MELIIPEDKLPSVAARYKAIQEELADDPRETAEVREAVRSVRNGRLIYCILNALGLKRESETAYEHTDVNLKPYDSRLVRFKGQYFTMRVTRIGNKSRKSALDRYVFQMDKTLARIITKAKEQIVAAIPAAQ